MSTLLDPWGGPVVTGFLSHVRSSGLDFKSNGKAISSEAITLASDLYTFN